MKKFILFLISATIFYSSFSQNPTSFIEIWAVPQSFSQKVKVSVNYGQEYGSFFKDNNDLRLVDSNGNPIIFNNHIDALNYFGQRGWKLEAAWQTSTTKGSGAYVFIMSKTGGVESFTTGSDYRSSENIKKLVDDIHEYKEYDMEKAISLSKEKDIPLIGYTKDSKIKVFFDPSENIYLIEKHFIDKYGPECLDRLINISNSLTE